MANVILKIGLISIVTLLVVKGEPQFGHGHGGWRKAFGSLTDKIHDAVEQIQESIPNLSDIVDEFSKTAKRFGGLKVLPNGSIQLTFQSPNYSKKTIKTIFDIIIRFLGRLIPRNEKIVLENGMSVDSYYIFDVFRRIFYLADSSQLSETDKAVLNYVWKKLTSSGFQLLGIPTNLDDSQPWLILWNLIHQKPQKNGVTLIAPNGQPVTWEIIWDILSHHLNGKHIIRLPNGRQVTLKSILKIIQDSGSRRKRKATSTERAVWLYIWNILKKKGFTIEGEDPNSIDSSHVEFVLAEQNDGETSAPVEIQTKDGKKVTLKLIGLALEKHLRGKKYIKIDGTRFRTRYVLKTLQKLGKKKNLDPRDINIIKFIWKLLQKEGFKIGNGSDSWAKFRDFLLQERHSVGKRFWKSLQAEIRRPHLHIPKINFGSIWTELLSQGINFKGIKIGHGGKIDFKWHRGKYDLGELNVLWKAIFNILEHVLKESKSNTIKISNGIDLTIQEIIEVLQDSLTLPSPGLLTSKQKAVWKFILQLLEESGINFIGPRGKHSGKLSWAGLFKILSHQPDLSQIQLPNFSKFSFPKLPEIKWTKFSSFNFNFRLPNIDFGNVLKDIEKLGKSLSGLKVLPNGKIEFSWQGGRFNADAVKAVQTLLANILQQAEEQTKDGLIDIGNGIQLTVPQIISILGQSFKVRNFKNLKNGPKIVLDYLANLLKQSGFSIGGLPWFGFRTSLSELLWKILRTEPALPNLNFVSLPSQKPSLEIDKLHLHKLWKKFAAFGKYINGLKFLPGGKIQISLNSGKPSRNALKLIWKFGYNLLLKLQKEAEGGLIDIGNGVKVTVPKLISILQHSLEAPNIRQLSDTAKIAWNFFWDLLSKSGLSIVGLPGHGARPISWDFLYSISRAQPELPDLEFSSVLDESSTFQWPTISIPSINFGNILGDLKSTGFNIFPGGKIQLEWHGGDFNLDVLTGFWKLVLDALHKSVSGGSIDIGNNIKLTLDEFVQVLFYTIKISDPQELSDKEKGVLYYLSDLLSKNGFTITGQPEGKEPWKLIWDILRNQSKFPSFKLPSWTTPNIPRISFDDILDDLKSIPGFKILPGGKIELKWQGGDLDSNTFTGVWKFVLYALQNPAKGGIIDIGNNIKLTFHEFILTLLDTLNVSEPEELNDKEENALIYLSNLLSNNSFSITGQPEGKEPWELIWGILRNWLKYPELKLPSWPDQSFQILPPYFKWPELEFPHLKFDAIWSKLFESGELIPGLTFLPDNAIQFSWPNGKFDPKPIDLLWKFILSSLDLLKKHSTEKDVQLSKDITLSWDQITSIVEKTVKDDYPEQLSPQDKSVWDFIAALLQRSGFKITDLPESKEGKPLWLYIWEILHQQPNAPAVPQIIDDSLFVELLQEEETTTSQIETATSETSSEPSENGDEDYDYDDSDDDYDDDNNNEDEQYSDNSDNGIAEPENELNFTESEKESLEKTLQTLNTQGDDATGDIELDGFTIPFSSLITLAHINNYDPKTLTIPQLTEIIIIFINQAKNSNNGPSNLPEDKTVILNILLNDLKTNTINSNQSIVFDGKEIPKDYIFKILKIQNIDIEKATPEVLYRIFLLYLNSDSTEKPEVDNSVESTLERLRAFIVQYGDRASGSLLFNGHPIPINTITSTLKLQKIELPKTTIADLWRIIQLIISTQEADSPPVDVKTFIFNYFIKRLQNPQDVPYATIEYQNMNISVADIVYRLGIEKDPETGKYSTDGITKDDLWITLQNYIADHKNSQTPESQQKFEVLKHFLEIISDPANVQNGILIVIYNGTKIQIQIKDVVADLNLQLDPTTGKYIIDQLTPDIFWSVIEKYLPNSQQTDAKEITLQYLINSLSDLKNVPNGSLIVTDGSGKQVKIPLQQVVDDLHLKIDEQTGNYDVSGLTADAVWDYLQQYLNKS